MLCDLVSNYAQISVVKHTVMDETHQPTLKILSLNAKLKSVFQTPLKSWYLL